MQGTQEGQAKRQGERNSAWTQLMQQPQQPQQQQAGVDGLPGEEDGDMESWSLGSAAEHASEGAGREHQGQQ